MFIKEVTMDGFKSYAGKTSVRPLDPKYTAITGLNGVGKSNIIDAIIFTLGLETRKHLRVSSMRELINTGRSECRVTVLFADTRGLAPAYAQHDEISVSRSLDSSGKSKFEINGNAASNTAVTRLCGLFGIGTGGGQLFIIMQGHITKILNMRSTDLQALIEDTAGTRSFVREKVRALAAIERKEIKLRDAREAFERRIAPVFGRLRKQREEFFYMRNIEELKNRYAFFEGVFNNLLNFCRLKVIFDALRSDVETYVIEKTNLIGIEEKLAEMNNFENEINSVAIKEELEDFIMKVEDIFNLNLEEKLKNKQFELESLNKSQLCSKLAELKARESILVKSCKSSGEIFNNDTNLSKFEELSTLKIRKAELECSLKHIKLNGDFDEERLKYFENFFVDEKELLSKKNKYHMLKAKIVYPMLDNVFGTIDENIIINDDVYKDAVYTIMGGRAKHVIVLNEKVATEILEKSDRRISVIPLNKITSKHVSIDLIENIKKDGGIHFVNILKYGEKVKKAIEHVFNGFFVFKNKDSAKKVCFEKNVICVTLDGTVYDPKGTLTGGRSTFKYDVVRKKDIEALAKDIKSTEEKLFIYNKNKEEYIRLLQNKEKLCKKNNIEEELSLISKKIEMLEQINNKNFDAEEELKSVRRMILIAIKEENKIKEDNQRKSELVAEISNLKTQIEINQKRLDDYKEKISLLQKKINEFEMIDSSRRLSEKQAESLEPKQKYLIKNTKRLFNKIHKIFNEYLEMKAMLGDFDTESFAKTLDKDSICQKSLNGELKDVFDELGISNEVLYFDVDKYLNMQVEKLYEKTKEVGNLNIQGINGFGCDEKENVKQTDVALDEDNVEDFDISFLKFNNIYDVIQNEDLILEKIGFVKGALKKLSRRKSIKMDPSNFELLEKNEIAIKNLQEKINKIEHDKNRIISGIKDLDILGIKENEKAFNHINKKLGHFLNYFFDNAGAHIEKTDEYELKVKIGNWKKSLLELSGGQRSLVALSLVFSMLTYKPAPFYIFDEIDSALDMSYTQSIGEIFKNEFSESQFIIVSLKNGMYDNANSVFKVYLKEGKPAICQIKSRV